jgi:predicted DNA-binding transcriptional regulator YafY
MNRTDRLLAIVLELQRHRRSYCRADDLASTFEVSKRTIYRDIQALCAAGVPIAVAGRHGYALAEGYFLPPLSFTTDEALILALGSDFMSYNFDDDYRAAAHSAYRKIDAILPPPLRNQVDDLKRGLHFFATKRLATTTSWRFVHYDKRSQSESGPACITPGEI